MNSILILLMSGMSLLSWGSVPAFDPDESYVEYQVVLPGESLSRIAQKEYDDVEMWKDIAQWNSIEAPYLIRLGQTIRLKDSEYQQALREMSIEGTWQLNRAADLFRMGKSLFEQNDLVQALWSFRRSRIQNKNYLPSWFFELEVLSKIGDVSQYQSVKQQLLTQRPDFKNLPMFVGQQ